MVRRSCLFNSNLGKGLFLSKPSRPSLGLKVKGSESVLVLLSKQQGNQGCHICPDSDTYSDTNLQMSCLPSFLEKGLYSIPPAYLEF